MKKRNAGAGPVRPETPVETLRHKDKRANIPTNELRGLLADDERAPGTMLYPRDPSLDPQLVWKGKDEQDAADLEEPVVPIYIQEKIHPQAIVENLRQTARAGEPEPELASSTTSTGSSSRSSSTSTSTSRAGLTGSSSATPSWS